MIIPVRCYSCGKVIGSSWQKFQEMLNDGKSRKEVLDSLGFVRMCCRGALMSHVETIDTVGRLH